MPPCRHRRQTPVSRYAHHVDAAMPRFFSQARYADTSAAAKRQPELPASTAMSVHSGRRTLFPDAPAAARQQRRFTRWRAEHDAARAPAAPRGRRDTGHAEIRATAFYGAPPRRCRFTPSPSISLPLPQPLSPPNAAFDRRCALMLRQYMSRLCKSFFDAMAPRKRSRQRRHARQPQARGPPALAPKYAAKQRAADFARRADASASRSSRDTRFAAAFFCLLPPATPSPPAPLMYA